MEKTKIFQDLDYRKIPHFSIQSIYIVVDTFLNVEYQSSEGGERAVINM